MARRGRGEDLRGKEEWASANAINQESTADGDDKGEDLVASVQAELLGLTSDGSAVVDDAGVVADQRVSRPLGDETKGDDDGKTVSVALCLDEVEVGGALLVQELEADGLLDFGVFELNGGIVLVAVGVELGQHSKGLRSTVLGDQPSRGSGVRLAAINMGVDGRTELTRESTR